MGNKKIKKEKPLVISASFDDLVKMSVSGNPAPKPKEKATSQDKVNAAVKLAKLVEKGNASANNKKAGG